MADLSGDILFIGCRSQRDVFPTNRTKGEVTSRKKNYDWGSPSAIVRNHARTWARTHELNPFLPPRLPSDRSVAPSGPIFSLLFQLPRKHISPLATCGKKSRWPVRVLIRAHFPTHPLSLSLSLFFPSCACMQDIYFGGARAPRGRSPKVYRFKDQEEHKLKVMARCVRVRSDVDVHTGPDDRPPLAACRFQPDGANVVLSRKPRAPFRSTSSFLRGADAT